MHVHNGHAKRTQTSFSEALHNERRRYCRANFPHPAFNGACFFSMARSTSFGSKCTAFQKRTQGVNKMQISSNSLNFPKFALYQLSLRNCGKHSCTTNICNIYISLYTTVYLKHWTIGPRWAQFRLNRNLKPHVVGELRCEKKCVW